MWRRLVQFIGSLYCQYYLQGCQANSADRKIVCLFKQWVHFILSYFLVLRNWEKVNHKTRYSRQWSCLSAKLKLNRFARSKWLHTLKGPLVNFFPTSGITIMMFRQTLRIVLEPLVKLIGISWPKTLMWEYKKFD